MLRQARVPVHKLASGFDWSHVRFPEGWGRDDMHVPLGHRGEHREHGLLVLLLRWLQEPRYDLRGLHLSAAERCELPVHVLQLHPDRGRLRHGVQQLEHELCVYED